MTSVGAAEASPSVEPNASSEGATGGEAGSRSMTISDSGTARSDKILDRAALTSNVSCSAALEAGSTGTLMTYLHKGKQYVVVAIGGVQHPAEFVAFSVP